MNQEVSTAFGTRGVDRMALLDLALAPLRRLLVFALAPVGGAEPARHLESNALRWLDRAVALADEAEGHALAEIRSQVIGIDTASDRHERLGAMFQELTRFDALHGLPLPAGVRAFVDRPVERSPARERSEAPPPARQPEVDRRASPGPAPRRLSDVNPETRLDTLLPGPLAEALLGAGLEFVSDLATLVPEGEEVLSPIHGAGRPIPPGRVAVGGRVARRWAVASPRGTTAFAILTGADRATLQWVDTPRQLQDLALAALVPNSRAVVVGHWEGGVLREPEVVHPGGGDNEPEDRRTVRLAAVTGIEARLFRAALHLLTGALGRLREVLPAELVSAAGLIPHGEALTGVHLRGSAEGRRRLAFEEALLLQLALAWTRFSGARERGISHPLQHTLLARVAAQLGLGLSDEAALAFEDVKRDLRRSASGMRVVSGSTEIGARLALHACILVAESRAQVFVACPDSVTAEERLTEMEPALREAGFVARCFVGEPSRANREALRRGEIHVVFAAPDSVPVDLEWRRLGLVVVFERAPFGGLTRQVATDGRAGRPDLLVVAGSSVSWATAVLAWPGFDVTHLAVARRPVHLEIAPATHRAGVYARAAARAPQEQVLVTFPLVGGSDALDLRDGLRLVRALESDGFSGTRVALYHGSMSREERTRVAEDVALHRVDVVVATTRYEEGGPLGRITAVLVEQAQSEDPSRVRKLVGIPRGPGAWVALIHGDDAPSPSWMTGLTEEPRTSAVGAPQLRWAGDDAIGWEARRVAHELLLEDPGLRRLPELARQIRERWSEWFPRAEDAAEGEGDDPEDDGAIPCPVPEGIAAGGEKKRRRRRRKKR